MADLEELLVKTSRTFALSIPLLEEPTRRQVTIAYLLFRIADTFEDAWQWPREERMRALDDLVAILERPQAGVVAQATRRWIERQPTHHEGYRELISEFPAVMAAWMELAAGPRETIGTHTRRTAQGMAGFVARTGEGGRLELRDLEDLKAYCYVVAGIVGEMLTELFLLGSKSLEPVASYLRQRASRFGEALQLVNILKDSADDAREGRRFLPAAVDARDVFAAARRDLEVAGDYVHALQHNAAPRGTVAFTALPVRLAWATLEEVERRGPGAKVGRDAVSRIVTDLEQALSAGRAAV
jgi:farnesyl-diphosphate farnesyltransferase